MPKQRGLNKGGYAAALGKRSMHTRTERTQAETNRWKEIAKEIALLEHWGESFPLQMQLTVEHSIKETIKENPHQDANSIIANHFSIEKQSSVKETLRAVIERETKPLRAVLKRIAKTSWVPDEDHREYVDYITSNEEGIKKLLIKYEEMFNQKGKRELFKKIVADIAQRNYLNRSENQPYPSMFDEVLELSEYSLKRNYPK
jgi:hypothetical protein